MLSKLITKALCFAALLLAGAACKYLLPVYGVPLYGSVPPREHPTVKLTDFSYTPASPIRIGDTLKLTARTNLPAADAQVFAQLPGNSGGPVELKDDGQAPDVAANDGIWTAEKTWGDELGTADNASIWVMLDFHGLYDDQMLARTITVLEEEE